MTLEKEQKQESQLFYLFICIQVVLNIKLYIESQSAWYCGIVK